MLTDGEVGGVMASRRATVGEVVLACALGLVAFFTVMPAGVIDPRAIDVVMTGDRATQFLGWRFFCATDWALPLGVNGSYVAPLGSTLILTDSLPPVAALLRALGACGLAEFQFLGLWMALCFMLQGATAWLLARLLGFGRGARALATLVCVFAPVLAARAAHPSLGHPTLCAHFLILLALAACVRPPSRTRDIAGLALVNGFTAALHPYLMVMVAALSMVAALRSTRRTHHLLVIVLSCVGGLLLTGAATANEPTPGFGVFQSDVVGFVDSWGTGRLLPSSAHRSMEGLTYLGAGVIAALALGLVTRSGLRLPRAAVVVSFLLWLGSLSTTIQVAGVVVAKFDGVAQALGPIASALRSSGRLAWPLWYVLVFVGVGAVASAARPRALLVLVGVLQLVDVTTLRAQNARAPAELEDTRWPAVVGGRKLIALVPPIVANSQLMSLAQHWTNPAIYARFALFAARRGVKINSGYLARVDNDALLRAFAALTDELAAGRPDPSTLYVFPSDAAPAGDPNLCCLALIDATACVARATSTFPCLAPAAAAPPSLPGERGAAGSAATPAP